ncbi:bifunctional 3-(3-hydroxy-phenyl)propionate/3-hydroxycinnamic acid hydroxylase [Actinoplanes teichomyceticus]|uniref:3-(3-hydroxy-phenyl)propionate hydroxylase n=1 Tax=Actinoplanes teichomyceticus TaxID=1867 RepID=A0A561VLE5_ACTTI|nr:bifunctional 3-(3-hydroxy-phenyl)propionate/3-hydroxycinnamic acid hydroxylase [Actinoplanes teichomyceticus]TWG12438.1 3-(3-hydroxy-phenyl)propionate hydroxylase [Actinoplanes teichomyceticus]GIF13799.1 3-(3-hydroxyphenyl)propionate hydroxylase [Actinoplanes teichomyceticus]
MDHVPVLVIGAGPTGATAAIMLAQRGVTCLVLDRWPQVYPLPRAVHFDDEVFRALAGLGIEDRLREISRPAPGMQLVDNQLRVLAEFTRDPVGLLNGYPQANMFDQPDLEQVLRDRLAELAGVQLRGGVEVYAIDQVPGGPGAVRVRYRELATGAEHEVWADAVLGCDGANSFTRTSIGAGLHDLGFVQQWLIVDVHSPQPLNAYAGAQQVCDHDRAASYMMVTPGRYRWEFRLRPGEQADDVTEAQVIGLIRPWLGPIDPATLTILRRTWYTFRGAVADRWQDRRVFLLGDAAHLTPPFIGQGMGAGIRDAANLTWKLALVLAGRADDRLLDTYEAERLPYARRMIQMAMLIGWIMTGGSARTARLRRAALAAIARLPGVERKVVESAWPAYRCGPLVAARDRAAGRLCPQPRLDGELLDRSLGTGFAIITRGPGLPAYEPAIRAWFDALGLTLADASTDPSGVLTRLLDQHAADALLIRPDRIIAASGDRPDLRAWQRLLQAAGIKALSERQIA